MKDYHNLYNLSDVLLLGDVFENFRNICMNHYGLDPKWYFSAPGLACDATLKITKVQLELLSDPDMLLMIESGIRRGIATISHRYAKANNEYIRTECDPTKDSKFITHLDANNIYGWAMSKQLRTSGFEWMTDNELDDWKHLSCFIEVDSWSIRKIYTTFALITLLLRNALKLKVEKLIPNLKNKTNYVVHYQNLKLYESLGLKITKIHRGIKFEESS